MASSRSADTLTSSIKDWSSLKATNDYISQLSFHRIDNTRMQKPILSIRRPKKISYKSLDPCFAHFAFHILTFLHTLFARLFTHFLFNALFYPCFIPCSKNYYIQF